MPIALLIIAIGHVIRYTKREQERAQRIAQGLPPDPEPQPEPDPQWVLSTRRFLGGLWDIFIDGPYQFGALICGVLSSLVAWAYLGSTYGMWGVLLGWLPGAIIGAIVGFLWPLAVLGGIILLIAINRH
jgi:hypothetical protein